MAHRRGMAEVELVEPGGPSAADDGVDRARSAVRGTVRRGLGWVGRHRVVAAAVVIALAVAVAVPIARSAQADRERAAALAALPSVVAATSRPTSAAWTSPSASRDY